MYHRLNNLGQKSTEEIIQAFETLPAVTSLDLKSNNLGGKTGAELAQVFAALPASVTSLNLRANQLCNKTVTELVQAFRALPVAVTNLDLGLNYLHDKTGIELAQVFAALPASLTNLDLSVSGLGPKTNNELVQIISVLPASLTHLNLSFNDLSAEQIDSIIKAVPSSLDSIIIDDETFYPNELYAKQLKAEVTKGAEQFSLDSIKLSIKIDEIRLNRLITILEKQNDSLAHLTCGLLLTRKIETSSYDHLEKRFHDAISFYSFAADERTIKPIVEALLWDMKTKIPIPSVQKRLSQYDLSPQNNCEILNQTSKNRSAVRMPLFAYPRLFKSLPESNKSMGSDSEVSTLILSPHKS